MCGCDNIKSALQDDEPQEYVASNVETLGLVPDLGYEKVMMLPHILVDEEGYASGSKKVLFVYGKNLEKEFSVIECETGKEVYKGRLTLVDGQKNDAPDVYMGEFTDLHDGGTYRAYHSQVGYSYDFSIGDTIYADMYRELYNCIQRIETEDNSQICYRMANLMFEHEIFPNSYMNKYYLRDQIQKLLGQMEPNSGCVYSKYRENGNGNDEISLSTTAEYAGVMANYYHDFYDDDPELATRCLQAATQSYASVVKYRDNVTTDSWYYAAASLYRATGNTTYRNAIDEYDAIPQKSRTYSQMNYELLADMAYLNTEYRADYVRCESIMQKYKEEASSIADATGKQSLYVREDIIEADEQEVLNDMVILGIVDYALSGREYSSIQENYLHYIFGRNPKYVNRLKCDYDGNEDGSVIYSIPSLSKLIFILGNG